MKKKLLLLIILISIKSYSQTHKLNSVIFNNNYKAEMLYDENSKNTSYKEYSFNSTTNGWEYDNYGKQYFYNADNLIDYTIFEESTFHNKYEYSYNSDNKLIEIVRFDQHGTNWDLIYTDTYNYDSLNNNIEFIRSWGNTDWYNTDTNYRYVNTFDSSNNLTLKEKQEWNTNTNSWNATNIKYEYTYNSDNRILSRIRYNLVNGNLEQVGKHEYIYDVNGNREEWASYYYDNNISNWIGEEKVTYNYDNNYELSDLFIPHWEGILDIGRDEDYNHMLTSKTYYEWDNTQNQWIDNGTAIINWSDITASVNNFEISTVKVYPNPAINQLNFEFPNKIHQIAIFNIQGKLLIKKNINNNSIDISKLNKGIYLYKINNNINGKFIKE